MPRETVAPKLNLLAVDETAFVCRTLWRTSEAGLASCFGLYLTNERKRVPGDGKGPVTPAAERTIHSYQSSILGGLASSKGSVPYMLYREDIFRFLDVVGDYHGPRHHFGSEYQVRIVMSAKFWSKKKAAPQSPQ
jgi:hypothetical protein